MAAPTLAVMLLGCPSSTPQPESQPPGEDEPGQRDPDDPAVTESGESAVAASAEPNAVERSGVLTRDELRRATRNSSAAYVMSQLRPVAHRPDGRFAGWKISTVFPDDPDLCPSGCDIEAGDIVLNVNGSPLERPEHLSALMDSVATMTELQVVLRRNGKIQRLSYQITDGPPRAGNE